MQAARSSPGFWADVVIKKVKRRNIVFKIFLDQLGRERCARNMTLAGFQAKLWSHSTAQLTEFKLFWRLPPFVGWVDVAASD